MHKRIVVFLHIPKTGGVTMRRLLDRQYTKQRVFRYPAEKPMQVLGQLTSAERQNIRCVYGHFRYGVHRHFHRRAVYITMVRDPLDRILSMYYFIRSRPQNKLHHQAKQMSFSQFVTSRDPRIRAALNNHQTRMISGKRHPDLKKAIENIKRDFVVVGITDMYPESVFMMKQLLGWKDADYTRENVTQNRPKHPRVPDHIVRIIRQNNALDYRLYRFAKNRLQQQIQHLTPQQKRDLSRFKKRH